MGIHERPSVWRSFYVLQKNNSCHRSDSYYSSQKEIIKLNFNHKSPRCQYMYCVLAISQKWEIAYSVLKNARLCAKIYVQGRERYKCVYHTCICSETSPDTYIFCNTICLCYTFMILYRFFLLDCEKRWRNATFFCCKKNITVTEVTAIFLVRQPLYICFSYYT